MKIWYLAQILQPTKEHVQQLTTVCTWFIWQGAIFRVPVSTLQLPKEQGCWALANIDAKCKTLLYARLWFLCTRDSFITTTLMRKWDLTRPIANPPKCMRPPNRDILYPSLCLGHGVFRPTMPSRNHAKVQKSSLRSVANNGQYGQRYQREANCPQIPGNRINPKHIPGE